MGSRQIRRAVAIYALRRHAACVLRKDDRDKATMLQRLFNEIYITDVVKHHKVRKKEGPEDLLNILPSSVGSLTNPEKMKNTFRSVEKTTITSDTVKRYSSYFADSFLLDEAKRYDIKGRAYISTPNKYYFSDLGLRNARL